MKKKENANSKKKVVQLCSFDSVYNDNLQKKLVEDNYFNGEFQLTAIILDQKKQEFLKTCKKDNYDDFSIIQKIIFWIRFNKYLAAKYPFDKSKDIVNIQFVDQCFLLLLKYLRNNFKHIVLSYWGSDLLRETPKRVKRLEPLYKMAGFITFETVEMRTAFEKIIGLKYRNKCRLVKFGLSELDVLDKISESDIKSFKRKYHIPDKRKIVVIGYNRIKQQQHLAVVRSLLETKISNEEIYIVFPWTYGVEDVEYKNDIISSLGKKYEYCFLEKRLSDNEVACLRKITNIFVQVQVTDSLSATMLETLYEEKIVITGKWLPYDELYRRGIKMVLVNNPDEVGFNISSIINGDCLTDKELRQNRELVRDISSWESNLKDWISLYKESDD